MPDLTEAQRERLAEALDEADTRWQHGIGSSGYDPSGPPLWLLDALAPVVAAIADEAAAEALDQRNEALDRLSDRSRAKWEAEDRYAALVDKVSALADEWSDEDAGIEHVAACQDFGCKTCVVIACGADLRALLEADQ
jgi:hypothetical protein